MNSHGANNSLTDLFTQASVGTCQQMSPYSQNIPHRVVPLISLGSEPVYTTAPAQISSPLPLSEYKYGTRNCMIYSPQQHSWNIVHQTVDPSVKLEVDTVYSCNFVGQLQGSYEIDVSGGQDYINVIVPNLDDSEDPYAIVRRVCTDGEALPDQFIYNDGDQFILCCSSGNVEAVMRKGQSMKHSVSWMDISCRSEVVWRRKGDVSFNLVRAESLASSRRNSICSVSSTSASGNNCRNTPMVWSDDTPFHIGSQLHQESVHCQVPNSEYPPSVASWNDSAPTPEDNNKVEGLFELFKAHCARNPKLVKNFVQWGIKYTPTRRLSYKDISTLSEGRIWVAARPENTNSTGEIEESLQERLDNLKGAYQRSVAEVFMQPEPQENEPGEQHRLFKDINGLWIIEGKSLESGEWQLCAKQLHDSRWTFDNGEVIEVEVIPLRKILLKLREGLIEGHQEVEDSVEFLFTSCNQKKLISKVKGRNLKHNISNLKMRIEKQHSLGFAVEVAKTAEAIAREIELPKNSM